MRAGLVICPEQSFLDYMNCTDRKHTKCYMHEDSITLTVC